MITLPAGTRVWLAGWLHRYAQGLRWLGHAGAGEAPHFACDWNLANLPTDTARGRPMAKTLEIEKYKLQIARLRRMQFGRSSEKIARTIEQLELKLEELETETPPGRIRGERCASRGGDDGRAAVITATPEVPRRALPAHLPARDVVQAPSAPAWSAAARCARYAMR
jgi:hypothetical protein